MVYSKGCHTVFYHRYPSTGELRLRVREIIRQVCDELGVEIVKRALSKIGESHDGQRPAGVGPRRRRRGDHMTSAAFRLSATRLSASRTAAASPSTTGTSR
jgi:hypothetical protein